MNEKVIVHTKYSGIGIDRISVWVTVEDIYSSIGIAGHRYRFISICIITVIKVVEVPRAGRDRVAKRTGVSSTHSSDLTTGAGS